MTASVLQKQAKGLVIDLGQAVGRVTTQAVARRGVAAKCHSVGAAG